MVNLGPRMVTDWLLNNKLGMWSYGRFDIVIIDLTIQI
jgi:hypothetical protein